MDIHKASWESARRVGNLGALRDYFFGNLTAKGREQIPIFGDFGLAAQLGSSDYARPRKFRERLERWLDLVRALWPICPAQILGSGDYILIHPAIALAAKGA